ncbi:cupin domain-containing protein [Parvularcula maris]|uniref:Cupin domain-containing protein n=1 Tax=Parvularcula maris TaxID=2965077 RepID=A0A9X2RKQ7_9PROT|nr:cupin domain-containing protein [Parvularcula maris]MCQ8186033.1 cupin domain-containing protein [Parvularcula maris]
MPKIDLQKTERYERQVYPGSLRRETDGYNKLKLSDQAGLSQFGFGEVTLEPGGGTSIPHWHEREDELIYVLEGEVTVTEGEATYTLTAGESAAWKAGVPVGHTVRNLSDKPARFLELGTRDPDEVAYYPGLDMSYRRTPGGYETLAGDPIGPDDDVRKLSADAAPSSE